MTLYSPIINTRIYDETIEVLCPSSGSFISGSSPVFSGSAGITAVFDMSIESLYSITNKVVKVKSIVIEALMNLNGLAESNPPPTPTTEQTLTYSFVT